MCPTAQSMCTAPNIVAWFGDYHLSTIKSKEALDDNPILPSDYSTKINFGDLRPKFKFLGKLPYSRLKDFTNPFIEVPCGQCLDCRIQQARSWADRVILEAKNYQHNYFITLTYDDEHLPFNGSLVPDDLSLFIKNIRNQFRDVKIRFFGCGEYGDTSRRPHLHLILFNCPLDDLSYDFLVKDGERFIHHYRPNNSGDLKFSMRVYKAWNFKGMISVGEVTYDSAAYVSQYVTKKHKPGMMDYYKKLNIEPEFVRMSTHPGIAHQYFEDNDDLTIFQQKIIIPSKGEAHLSVVPRYFDKLFIKKYGEDIFNHGVRNERNKKRAEKSAFNVRNNLDLDHLRNLKDYKIKKRHTLRSKI